MSSAVAAVSSSAVSTSFVVGVSVAVARVLDQRVLLWCDKHVAFFVIFTVVLPLREVATCDRWLQLFEKMLDAPFSSRN